MTLILPSTKISPADTLFLFRASDCIDEEGIFARSYGRRLGGAFSRGSRKVVADSRGALVRLPDGAPPLSWLNSEPVMLLEPARTNLCLRSEEFDNAVWVKTSGVTVSANVVPAPDGSLTADLLSSDGSGAFLAVSRGIGFTGDGEKCAAIFLRAGSAALTAISIYDVTAATHRHRIAVTWTAGVPTLTTQTGSGTLFPVESVGGGWYRILFSAAGVIAANSHILAIYAAGTAAVAGTVYAWGAEAEDAAVPSSYIKTEGSTVTRATDSLYFPFNAPPQAMTVYVRGVEQERANAAAPGFSFVTFIGSATEATDPRCGIYRSTGGAGYAGLHDPATQSVTALVGGTSQRGAPVELRLTISSGGAPQLGASVNGAAESVSALGTAQPLGVAWAAPRIYLNSAGTTGAGQFAFTHIAIAAGERDLATMRALAGV